MLANWKPLALGAIGLILMIWLGPLGGIAPTRLSELAMHEPAPARDCASQLTTRCTIEVKYAYPAAELYVAPDDSYF
jgi:hypothetical protein